MNDNPHCICGHAESNHKGDKYSCLGSCSSVTGMFDPCGCKLFASPVAAQSETTDEQKVKQAWPEAIAKRCWIGCWHILRNVRDREGISKLEDSGNDTAEKAWADAASRLPAASPESVATPSQPIQSEPLADLIKFVWKTYPEARKTELPKISDVGMCVGMCYGIIDRARIQNAELSELHDSPYEAWLDAATRLGYTTTPSQPEPQVGGGIEWPKETVSDQEISDYIEPDCDCEECLIRAELQQYRALRKGEL